MNDDNRKVAALLTVDNNRAIEENMGTLDYVMREAGWMEQSGITMDCAIICDDTDEARWSKYINYLIRWAMEHSSTGFEGMSPVGYAEWLEDETIKS